MPAIRIVLDRKLLRATDRAAKNSQLSRSSLIRNALREHLKSLHILELELRDQRSYQKHPDNNSNLLAWERVAAWPD